MLERTAIVVLIAEKESILLMEKVNDEWVRVLKLGRWCWKRFSALWSHGIILLPRNSQLSRTSTSVFVTNVESSAQTEPVVLNLALPWLVEFDASRLEEDPSKLLEDHSLNNNIYRHPDRWGLPTLKTAKSHDLYSLVSDGSISIHSPTSAHLTLLTRASFCWR